MEAFVSPSLQDNVFKENPNTLHLFSLNLISLPQISPVYIGFHHVVFFYPAFLLKHNQTQGQNQTENIPSSNIAFLVIRHTLQVLAALTFV